MQDGLPVSVAYTVDRADGEWGVPVGSVKGEVTRGGRIMDPVEVKEVLDGLASAGGEWNGAGRMVLGDFGPDVQEAEGLVEHPEVADEEFVEFGDAQTGVGKDG